MFDKKIDFDDKLLSTEMYPGLGSGIKYYSKLGEYIITEGLNFDYTNVFHRNIFLFVRMNYLCLYFPYNFVESHFFVLNLLFFLVLIHLFFSLQSFLSYL